MLEFRTANRASESVTIQGGVWRASTENGNPVFPDKDTHRTIGRHRAGVVLTGTYATSEAMPCKKGLRRRQFSQVAPAQEVTTSTPPNHTTRKTPKKGGLYSHISPRSEDKANGCSGSFPVIQAKANL